MRAEALRVFGGDFARQAERHQHFAATCAAIARAIAITSNGVSMARFLREPR